MQRRAVLIFSILLLSVAFVVNTYTEPVSIPGIVKVTASERTDPPAWAVLERHLIRTMNEAAPEFLNKYAYPGGRMPQIGKPDV